jgi:hypothetical protein
MKHRASIDFFLKKRQIHCLVPGFETPDHSACSQLNIPTVLSRLPIKSHIKLSVQAYKKCPIIKYDVP